MGFFENRVTPLSIQINANIHPPKSDPLGALDAQGQRIVIDTKTDPIGALNSPFGGFPKSPREISSDRLFKKSIGAVSLAPLNHFSEVEISRGKNLQLLEG